MSDIQIIDDLIDPEDNKIIHEVLMSNDFPWYFNTKTTEPKYHYLKNSNVYEAPFFSHIFVGENKDNSEFNDLVFPMICRFRESIDNLDTNLNVNRIKANLYMKNIKTGTYNTPHVDDNDAHAVMLYFVNDCDGNTVFFKNKQLEILEEIEPKAGRAVYFNGSIYHASNHPVKSDYRITLNFNFSR
jgi:hypothetical protein